MAYSINVITIKARTCLKELEITFFLWGGARERHVSTLTTHNVGMNLNDSSWKKIVYE